jgi:hyperosmotically inducible protein
MVPDTGAGQTEGLIRDDIITRNVVLALAGEPTLSTSDIRVETKAGFVTLTGSAGTPVAQQVAIQIAGKVEGVKGVAAKLNQSAAR